MENHLEFVECLKENKISAAFHGHVHNPYVKKINNIDVYAAPATCIQFALTPELILEPFIGYQKIYLSRGIHEHQTVNFNFEKINDEENC
jgi:hypothetical protein